MKKNLLAVLLIVLLAVCLCVSCEEEINDSAAGTTWKTTKTVNYTEADGIWEETIEYTLAFSNNGTITLTMTLKGLTLDGVDKISTVQESKRVQSYTGTYRASSSTTGSFLIYIDSQISCTYMLSENKILLSEAGEPFMDLYKV